MHLLITALLFTQALAFPHNTDINAEASGTEASGVEASGIEASVEASGTEASGLELGLVLPTASSIEEALAALKAELEGSSEEPNITEATTLDPAHRCKVFDLCYTNDDCPGGSCLGTFVGRCNCMSCRNFFSCKTDADCGGLKGSCSDLHFCDCNEGLKKAGYPFFLDALLKFCNQKTCTAETAEEDCFGLECNPGRCIC